MFYIVIRNIIFKKGRCALSLFFWSNFCFSPPDFWILSGSLFYDVCGLSETKCSFSIYSSERTTTETFFWEKILPHNFVFLTIVCNRIHLKKNEWRDFTNRIYKWHCISVLRHTTICTKIYNNPTLVNDTHQSIIFRYHYV